MMKRILSVILAAVMLVSCFSAAAFAEDKPENVYHYVALGDSISAGYGLSEDSLSGDPALIITEESLKNPVTGAYPALFGNYLAKLGSKYGYTVTSTNLAAPIYNAEDVQKTILVDGYKSEAAAAIFDTFLEDGSAPLTDYHDIFVKYLGEADMVSILIGANELSIGLITPLTGSDNIILSSIGYAFMLTLFGYEPEQAVGIALGNIAANIDLIDDSAVVEAIAGLNELTSVPAELVNNAVDETKNLISAIRTVNPDTDIALLSQINVWGNSLVCDGKEYTYETVMKDILFGAIEIVQQDASDNNQLRSLLSLAADELAYPVQYLTLGQSLDPYILTMNEKLQDVAEETGVSFVDIYGIDNKKGTDPHPNAKMHRQIADRMWGELADTARAKMSGELPEEKTGSYKVTRISNPDNNPGDVDGLFPGGDRGNSYTWRLAQRGDDIYIATYRHLLNGVVNLLGRSLAAQGISLDTTWALADLLTNGEFAKPDDPNDYSETCSLLVKYNTKTGEFSTVHTFRPYEQCRMVVNYEDMIYAGTFSSVLSDQYLFRIDENDNVEPVIKTSQSFSIRANCVYDAGEGDHLYFAGADENEVLDEGDEDCCKVAVWEKDADDDFVWNRVADYHDFYRYTRDSGMKNNTGCPVWELANHNGYIYAGMPYTKGFLIFRGRPAEEGEEANAYGWIWEEVVGETNGVNNPGMAAKAAGHDDVNFSSIVSVYEFNGELYAFDFDQTIMAALAFVSGGLSAAAGADVSLSDMVAPVYRTLNHHQNLWKLNDETGAFEACEGFADLMKGTCNEYVWRAQEHDGYMYVSTMDSAVLYNYMTWLTNGYLCTMSDDQIKREIGYIYNFIEQIKPMISEKAAQRLTSLTDSVKEMLLEVTGLEISGESLSAFMEKYEYLETQVSDTLNRIKSLLGVALAAVGSNPEDVQSAEIAQPSSTAEQLFSSISSKLGELIESVDWEGIRMYLYINDTVVNDNWGFDIVRTKDGVNFEVVTDDGFGDRYNYGCAAFLSTDEGLYIGTCNPFYGGQLYLLSDSDSSDPIVPSKSDLCGDVDGNGSVNILDVTCIQRKLAGLPLKFVFDNAIADVDGDGYVTIIDAAFIQRWLVSLPSNDRIGKSRK